MSEKSEPGPEPVQSGQAAAGPVMSDVMSDVMSGREVISDALPK
ncbi:MAG TPA: hypothetical protein VIZ20_06185 [Streptosporangiaceae bacterium]